MWRCIAHAPGALEPVLPHPAGIAEVFLAVDVVRAPERRVCDPTYDASLRHARRCEHDAYLRYGI